MVINGRDLLLACPIVDMLSTKEQAHGVSHGLAEVGYDIRIKQEVIFKPVRYWANNVHSAPTVQVSGGPVIYGNFTLASAIEEFQMPDNLVGIVHDKSTWARKGLSVFNTVIESGWKGFLTLELVYHGDQKLHIPAGSGIAQVIFHQTSTRSSYTGKYQNQADQPVPSVFE